MKSQTLGLYYWMLIIISIIFTVESNAQNWRCGAIHPSNADYLASISTGNNVASGITVQRSLPIHFFVVRNTNGILPGNNTSLGSSSTLSTFMRTEIELANQAFGQASISFYISDIDFIDNSAWFNFDLAQISNIHSAYNDANAINVYLVNTLTSGDGGYAHFPGGSPSNVVFLSVSVGPKYVLAHELGHYFNLFHTFYDTFMDGPSNSAAYSGDCATTGDMMCDTPPEPVCNSNLSWSCTYGCESNPRIVIYQNNQHLYYPQRENIMSYNQCFAQSFTTGQINRILHALNTHPNRAFLIDNNAPTALLKLPSPTAVATRKNEIDQSLENLRQLPVTLVREGNTIHSVTSAPSSGTINVDVGNFIPGGYLTGRLVPEKNLTLNAGISSMDLGMLQKHIIYSDPITTPYRLIAADVNNSGHVSTFDAIWLQKIILGTYTSLQGNTSWRYIPSYALNDPTFAAQLAQDPFTAIWTGNNEQRGYLLNPASGINKTYFDDLDISLLNPLVDQPNTWSFQAIKVGDLDFSASPYPFKSSGMPELRGDPYTISYNEKECLTKGQLYEIELLGNSKEDLYVYQLGAKFDPAQIEIVRCEADQIKGFNQDNYNPVALKDGELKVVWIDLEKGEKVKFNAKKALFKVVIRPKVDICNLAEAIHLDKQVLPTMFLSERLQDQSMELEWSVKKTSKLISGTSGANVFPNPTNDQVSFEIKLDHFQPLEVVLMDVNGRTLSIKQDGYKGINRIHFSSLSTFGPGLISYRIQLKERQLSGTFIKF